MHFDQRITGNKVLPKTDRLTSKISCPRCSTPVNSGARFCEFCGVDLAIAAAIAERDLAAATETRIQIPPSLEILVPRLGEYLLDKGVINADDLQKALDYQKKIVQGGRSLLLGQTLLELNLVDRDILDRAVIEQILLLQHALQKANRQLEERVQERTAELQAALVRLSELNQLKSNFISNISHELRTPLTHIKGYLELLRDGDLGSLSTQQQHAVDVAVRSSERLQRLIEDLLQFSLAVQGELSLKLDQFNLKDLLQYVAGQFKVIAQSKDIIFQVLLHGGELPLQADSEKLEWVLSQLLDNAIKFTEPGGKVRLSANESDGLVTVAVVDSGIGIPEERLNEIFLAFHQLDGSSSRRSSGVGLGLAYANRILEAHGTRINVWSNVGKGSRFEFSLPLSPSATNLYTGNVELKKE